MKANMTAMKEQVTTMMEAMMSMRKMVEVNIVIVVATSTATKRDLIHSSRFNQESHPVLDVVGQGGEAMTNAYGLHYV